MVDIAEKLKDLGPRPCPEAVEEAREALAVIDANVSRQLDSIAVYSDSIDNRRSSSTIQDIAAEQEKVPHKTVLWLDQLYQSYEAIMATKVERESPENEFNDKSSTELNLSGLQLTRLVPDPAKLCSLVSLDLSKNNLEALPDYFDSLNHLRVLNVSGNMLKTLPESISRCSTLLELDASFNQLEYMSSNFGQNLPQLQRLSLQLNKLSTLPSAITSLASLTHLELQFNKLLMLPVDIGNLRSLIKLNASGNFSNLTTLPDSIGSASSLEVLDLSYNQITKLPLSFGKLTQLKELRLVNNPVVVPPVGVVEHSTKAVVEYMSELLKKKRLTVNATSCRSNKRRGGLSLVLGSSWFGEFLGGMCQSSSLVLGGSNRVKFVDLRHDTSDSE